MNYRFLHKIFLNAPAAFLAAAFMAQSASGELIVEQSPDSLESGQGEKIVVSFDESDVRTTSGSYRNIRIYSTDGVVQFRKLDNDGNVIGTAANSITLDTYSIVGNMVMGKSMVEAWVVAKNPGTATVNVDISGTTASEQILIEVVAPTQFGFVDAAGNSLTRIVTAEANSNDTPVSVLIDFGYDLSQTINFTVTSDDATGRYLIANPPLPAYRGNRIWKYDFTPLDGTRTVNLTFTGDTAYTTGQSLAVTITNKAPSLSSPVGSAENPDETTALKNATKRFTAFASDVDADAALTYRWYLNDNPLGDAYSGSSIDYPISAAGTMAVEVLDKDGGISRRGYWKIDLVDAATVKILDETTISAINDVQGVGATVFYNDGDTFHDDIPKAWDPDNGNYFYQNQDINIRAVPADSSVTIQGQSVTVPSYRFGWFFQDPSLTDEANLYVPNNSTKPILMTVPSSGTTIRFLSSNPFLGYYDETTMQPIDQFGDIDQDGLSDSWEAYYFDGGKDGTQHTSTEWGTLATMNATGEFGSSGTSYNGGDIVVATDTPDNDRLPTKSYEDIKNVWTADPYYAANTGNLVRVYVYPLTGSAFVNYGTYIGDLSSFTSHGNLVYPSTMQELKQVESTDKPFFDNLTEFRGIPQARQDQTSGAWPAAANFVRVGYSNVLTRATSVNRGNAPGTDPRVDDTDGDAMSDGWEYYFWSTILYENKPEYWRAYDPTFTLYPDLAPWGTSDFRAAGIPLLKRNFEKFTVEGDSTSYPVEYSGGMLLRFPDEEFKPTIIRSDCHYGYPLTTAGGGEGSHLTNAPICHLDYVDEYASGDVTNAAVEFVMGDSFRVFTRNGKVDARGRATLWFQPYTNDAPDYSAAPVEISGAYVDYLSGEFYLPGYDAYPTWIQEQIGSRDAKLVARYRSYNGVFDKQFLLNKFDPNDLLAPNFSCDTAKIVKDLGLEPSLWNPNSDLDNDGLPDLDEYFLGTNPLHWDTDNDGMPDGWEVIFGLDPHDRNDGSANPDGDSMYAVGNFRHVDAFLYDYFNQTYWNGQASLGFLPGVATLAAIGDTAVAAVSGVGTGSGPGEGTSAKPFTNREEFYVLKWMMGKDGRYPLFTTAVYPSQWQITYEDEQFACMTTDPRNDDTDEDHIPDGWALYAGYYANHPTVYENTWTSTSSSSSVTTTTTTTINVSYIYLDLIDYTWQNIFGLPPMCPNDRRADPDEDKLGWQAEFENWTTHKARKDQATVEAYVSENVRSYHDADWYKPVASTNWTNKLYPTSPWIADTDGDGISDGREYQEEEYEKDGVDFNGDRLRLVNLNPTSADTNKDRLPDGWQYLAGLYNTTNSTYNRDDIEDLRSELGPYGDPDGDGLPNYQEYLTGAIYGWRYDKWYAPDDKTLWVPDATMDGESLAAACAADPYIAAAFSVEPLMVDGQVVNENAFVDAFPYGKSVHFRKYKASDFFRDAPSPRFLNDGKELVMRLEKRWASSITHVNPFTKEVTTAAGWDRTFSPTMGDLEAAQDDPAVVVSPWANWIQRAWALLNDRLGRYELDVDPETGDKRDTAFISVSEYSQLDTFLKTLMNAPPAFSYGCVPASWESSVANDTVRFVDKDIPVIWAYMPNNYFGVGGFPGTMPRNPDSDNDGMDDYWEIFHGLNPTYGGSFVASKSGDLPDGDRADNSVLGDGSLNDWQMGNDPARVRNRQLTEIGYQPVTRMDSAFHTPIFNYPIASAARFDYKTRPWLAGDPTSDSDQDGLSNLEESYNEMMNDVLHHTDPSPYWFTDPSYAESYVNLYYAVDGELGGTYWWWDRDILGTLADGPSYLFDFEVNEGFDTDNDNISDREEISASNSTGVTDPQDEESPRWRKALYFDGHAAARTRNPFFHDKWTLTSYTVEFWVRPQTLPGPGRMATLVQRPVYMPVDDSTGATRYQIRHTFLIQLDELGQIHARVDGDSLETVSSVTAVSTGRLAPDIWTHVAVVMDSKADLLTVYLNGVFSGREVVAIKPCTGTLNGAEYLLEPTANNGEKWESYRFYDYSPAPIVLGAYDRNPLGVVAGVREASPWGLPSLRGNSQPDFDPDQYFNGWIDEVRIWDRCRTHDQIVNNMPRRFSAEDINKVNFRRWRWEMQGWTPGGVGENLVSTTTQDEIPQRLLYHYSFDNLPDLFASEDRVLDSRVADLFAADSSASPLGWNSTAVSSYRPSPFWTAPEWYPYGSTILPHLVPWWYTATHRSTTYTDYSYVPFIENTVAHMPQWPAVDMRGLVPNFDTNIVDVTDPYGTGSVHTQQMQSWELLSYRRRSKVDWVNDCLANSAGYKGSLGFQDIIPAVLAASGSADVGLERIRNTKNPYGMLYRTAVNFEAEVHPYNYPGELDRWGVYHSVPVLTDMLPLMDAVADIDVPMWDGLGRGTELATQDSDGDGLPDWWEIAHGLDYNGATGDNGAFGDPDGDGLDNYAEYLAQTDPYRFDTDSDGYSDYYSRASGTSLTWGELYDDGDGMDNAWETEYGLDPDRYDADGDLDVDGWTNWEEYMAGTDPTRADLYPDPSLNVTFYYDGEYQEQGKLFVYTYGEKRSTHVHSYLNASRKTVTVTNYWGGSWDGKYYGDKYEIGTFNSGSEEQVVIGKQYLNATVVQLASTDVSTADPPVITVNRRVAGRVQFTASPWEASDDYWVFCDDNEDLLFIDYRLGKLYHVTRSSTQPQSGHIFGDFSISYTVAPRAYPLTISDMRRVPSTYVYQHMVSGYNRFFGWLDIDGNGDYNIGEPAGISLANPTLVSWDSVDAEIPLTDELFGFPRLSWAPSTNNLITRYRVMMWANSNNQKSALDLSDSTKSIIVEAPRTYIHEGDFIDAGIKGVCLNGIAADAIDWEVYGINDKWWQETLITNGSFTVSFLDDSGLRRTMEPVSPVGGSYGEGAIVEFKWNMDWRTEGVFFTVKDSAGNTVEGLDNLYVPFPVCHGKHSDGNYYYTARPQLVDGRSVVFLPVGSYTYTIKENLRTTVSTVKAQTITGSFEIVSNESDKGALYARYGHSASGSVRYFGKVSGGLATDSLADAEEICAGPEFDGTAWTWTGGDVSGDDMIVEFSSTASGVVPGSMVVELTYPATDGTGAAVTERLNDRSTRVATDGTLFAESGSCVWSGSIRYPEEEGGLWTVKIVFDSRLDPPPAGTVVKVYRKAFRAPLIVEAFKLPDNATTSLAVSGQPVAVLESSFKGAFEFTGLESGNYAFRAFIDSNGNGALDAWETQGLAVISGTDSPVMSSASEMIVIDNGDISNLLIVLHDRDTDNDLLPDAWEYEMWGDISKHSGMDASGVDGSLLLYQEYADGPLDSDPRTPDTDLDGLTDAMELLVVGTDTHLTDSDGDGVGDLEEFLSGSNPNEATDTVPYTMPALKFDADGAPFVDCAYPALQRGVTLTYQLQRKASLDAAEPWECVDELVVAATPETEQTVTVADGVSSVMIPAGVARMTPADKDDTIDWKSGFFRVRIFADYGKMVENDDGTCSFWTWTDSTGSFEEVARGEGVLERDIDGNWQFVDQATHKRGSLVRNPDGSWSFYR